MSHASLPKEMAKVSPLYEYDIGLSDVLIVEAVRVVPKSPYRLQASDYVEIRGYGLEDQDYVIDTQCRILPGGAVILPPPLGAVVIAGMTCEEAGEMLSQRIRGSSGGMKEEYLAMIGVSVNLLSISGLQPIAGEHLVGPDGRVNLGIYGGVHVAGLTLAEAKEAIEFQLAKYLDSPEVAVDVYGLNSKYYYVITQGAGYGDRLEKLPYTGNETVIDAIAEVKGLERVSSKHIWIARPSPMYCSDPCQYNIIPVSWQGISAQAEYCTNYQLMPGDRVYIAEDKMVALDTKLSKIIAPFERVMGFSLLGAQTVTRFSGPVLQGGGNPTGGRY